MFALVIIGIWADGYIHSEHIIKSVYQSVQRKEPEFLQFGSTYEDQLKNWLCYPEKRKHDLIAIDGIPGINSMYCHGIETDTVLHIGSACENGCVTTLNPVTMTRAKAFLVLAKYQPKKCDFCLMRFGAPTALR